MTYPPPPPTAPRVQVQEKPPVVGWLIPVAGVVALIGAILPWFSPQGTLRGQVVLQATDNLHSWEDGRIGLIGPIIMIVVGVGVIGLMTGRTVSRFERGTSGPVVTAARGAMIAGGVAIVAVVIAWFFVPGQYDEIPADAGGSWDGAERLGIDLTRGPQLGYWLTIVAAAVALLGGALMLVLRNKPQPVAGPVGEVPSAQGFPPPSAYPPPAAYPPPTSQGPPAYGPGPQQGYPQQGHPQQGYPQQGYPSGPPQWQLPPPPPPRQG